MSEERKAYFADKLCEHCDSLAVMEVCEVIERPPENGYRCWKAGAKHFYCEEHKRNSITFYMDGFVEQTKSDIDMNIKLCPFCGHIPLVEPAVGKTVVVMCDQEDCGVNPEAEGHSVEKALKRWNRRNGK